MKNKRGFTLIELLAVIIILGILMIIAIPSVTTYISNSRKTAYVDTAKEIVGGTRNLVNEGKLEMYDTNTTYYIPVDYIKTENASKSPYGEFTYAYVGVVYDGNGYKYYWISVDETGQGVDKVTLADKLETDDIKSNIKEDDVIDTVKTTGIGNRTSILILQDGQWSVPYNAENHTGEDGSIIVYPTGKDKSTVSIGDKVIIGTEEFYVLDINGDDLILLARYNLNVGVISDYYLNFTPITPDSPGYGRQSSKALGLRNFAEDSYGVLPFSTTNYWNGKVGTSYSGNYCNNTNDVSNCAYVYDSNSNLYQYVESYKDYLEDYGITIKEARIPRLDELVKLGCNSNTWSCDTNYAWIYETTYWIGTPDSYNSLWDLSLGNNFGSILYSNDFVHGVRPVIVI